QRRKGCGVGKEGCHVVAQPSGMGINEREIVSHGMPFTVENIEHCKNGTMVPCLAATIDSARAADYSKEIMNAHGAAAGLACGPPAAASTNRQACWPGAEDSE